MFSFYAHDIMFVIQTAIHRMERTHDQHDVDDLRNAVAESSKMTGVARAGN